MAEHPPTATQPTTRFTSSPRALQRNDNNHLDVFTAPMTQSFSTSSSGTRRDTVRQGRVRPATKVKTRSSSSKTKRKHKPKKSSKCRAPSRVGKKCRVQSVIHWVDAALSSTPSEAPVPTPTLVLSTSNLRGQQFYDPIQRFYDSQDDGTPYFLAFGGDIAPQDEQYPFGYGAKKPLSSQEHDALISAMTEIHIGGNTSQMPLD